MTSVALPGFLVRKHHGNLESVSKPPQDDHHTNELGEVVKEERIEFVASHQSPERLQSADRALDDPPSTRTMSFVLLPRLVGPKRPPFWTRQTCHRQNFPTTRPGLVHRALPPASAKPLARCQRPTNRRQHVMYDGNERGKSCHRSPHLSTHKMPSRQCRRSTRCLPLRIGRRIGRQISNQRLLLIVKLRRKSSGSGSILDPAMSWNREPIEEPPFVSSYDPSYQLVLLTNKGVATGSRLVD